MPTIFDIFKSFSSSTQCVDSKCINFILEFLETCVRGPTGSVDWNNNPDSVHMMIDFNTVVTYLAKKFRYNVDLKTLYCIIAAHSFKCSTTSSLPVLTFPMRDVCLYSHFYNMLGSDTCKYIYSFLVNPIIPSRRYTELKDKYMQMSKLEIFACRLHCKNIKYILINNFIDEFYEVNRVYPNNDEAQIIVDSAMGNNHVKIETLFKKLMHCNFYKVFNVVSMLQKHFYSWGIK